MLLCPCHRNCLWAVFSTSWIDWASNSLGDAKELGTAVSAPRLLLSSSKNRNNLSGHGPTSYTCTPLRLFSPMNTNGPSPYL